MSHEDEELEAAAAVDPEDLSDEIARKWDPERLLKMVATRAGRGEALDHSLRARYERKLGIDLSNVRIYAGEFAENITRAHNADAITVGNTGMIFMGGSPDKSMAGAAGHGLLAHELTHVAQSQRGMFRSASFGEAAPLATEEHEAEAEEAAASEEAEQRGEGGKEDPNAKDEAEKEQLEDLLHRVLDMFAEAGRISIVRGGPALRRP